MKAQLRTLTEAKKTLATALEAVDGDNPVAATRAVAGVARVFRPEATSSWESFRFTAAKILGPYFESRPMDPAKAAAWAVCDPFYGQLEQDESDRSVKVDRGRDPRAVQVRRALTGSGP